MTHLPINRLSKARINNKYGNLKESILKYVFIGLQPSCFEYRA